MVVERGDELPVGQDAAEVFHNGTLIDDLKKAVAELALDAEAHLEREPGPPTAATATAASGC